MQLLTTIEYNGISFPVRETKEGLISTVELAKLIWDHSKGYPSKEAQQVDEMIYGFVSPSELHLPERKLLNLLK